MENKKPVGGKLEEDEKRTFLGTLLSLGKAFLRDYEYRKAEDIFKEIKKSDEFRTLTDLYGEITSVLIMSNIERGRRYVGQKTDSERDLIHMFSKAISEGIVQKTIDCMMESSNMYADKTLSEEDFLEIELLIDRIPFKEISIQNRREFNQIYCGFKEYALEVFLEK